MNPEIAFITLGWNNVNYIKKCFDSISLQSYRNHITIFVDNDSQDNSIQFIKKNYPNVYLLPQNKNTGFANANNIGIKYVLENFPSIKFFCLLNIDTYIPQDFLKNFFIGINRKTNYYNTGIFAPKVLLWDEKTIHSTGVILNKDLSAENRGMFERDKGQYDNHLEVFGAIGAGMILTRESISKIASEWMDSTFFVYREDDDLNWKNQLLGFNARFIPKCIIYHKGGGTTRSFSIKKIFYLERNRIFILIKYASFSYFLKSFIYSLKRYISYKNNKTSTIVTEKPPMISLIWTIFKAHLYAFSLKRIFNYLKFRRKFHPTVKFETIINKYL